MLKLTEEEKIRLRKEIGSSGKPLLNIFRALRVLSEVRDKYNNRDELLKYISETINEDIKKVIEFLESAGVYLSNDSETVLSIKEFIVSIKDKYTEEEIIERVNFNYCISYPEAKRLVKMFLH